MRKENVNNKSNELESTVKTTVKSLDTDNIVKENETIQSNSETQKDKDKDKLKIIILIVVTVLAVCITAVLLIYKYFNTNKQKITGIGENNNTQAGIKTETKDAKYLVSFTDMYTVNPIKITDKSYEKKATKKQGSINANYIEISGLQNKEIEDKINKEIKDTALYNNDKTDAKQEYYSYVEVRGNFNNILSVSIYVSIYVTTDEGDSKVFEEYTCLNYNLATGEKIKFLDLFASNTPMNSIIYDLEYERLAWDTEMSLEMSEKEWEKATNMDKRDTSEYEDKILKVINKYKNLDKDNIQFYVTPNKINVKLNVGEGTEEVSYNIYLYKYADYVTLYKKFLTDDVVYENVSNDKLLVFNDMLDTIPEYYKIEADNLFISIFNYDTFMEEWESEIAEEYSQSVVNKKNEIMNKYKEKILNDVRALAKSNKNNGYMARFLLSSQIGEHENDYGGEVLITIYIDAAVEQMNIDYYKENAFKLLAKQNAAPKVGVDEIFVNSIASNDNTNVKNLLDEEERFIQRYYTLDGTLVATTYEGVEKYLDGKYTEPKQESETNSDKTSEQQQEVEIYKEEE